MIWILILISNGAYSRGNTTEFSKTFDTQASCEEFGKKIEKNGNVQYVCAGYSR